MAPRRVIDFLKWAESYHAKLADFYRDRSAEVSAPKVKELLVFMARHEDALRKIIADYERGASAAILETWYKPAPALKAFEDSYTAGFKPDMTFGEAIELALDLDKCLVSMYEMLIRNAPAQGLREMLQDLLARERSAEIQMMRAEFTA